MPAGGRIQISGAFGRSLGRPAGRVDGGGAHPGKDMKTFKLLNRPLYDGSAQSHKIVRSGGGSGKEKPDAA